MFLETHQNKLLPLELAECYHEYGKWWYKNRQKEKINLDNAIAYTKQAVQLKKENKASKKSLKKSLYNLGFFYLKKGNNYEAMDCYQQIKDIPEVDEKTFFALDELADIYRINGDYQRSISNLDFLISKSFKENTIYQEWLVGGYLGRARVYSEMSRQKYSKRIKRDLEKVDSLLSIYSTGRTIYHNMLYQNEGNRLLENGYYKKSILYFNRILEHISEIDREDIAKLYNSLGQAYSKLEVYDKAIFYFDKAIVYKKDFTHPYENKGDLYIEKLEFELGLKEYQKAINILVKADLDLEQKLPVEVLESVQQKYYLLHHLTQKANGWIQFYKADKNKEYLEYALQTFKTADKLIDIIRFESTEIKSKLYWREHGASLYLGAVEVCSLLDKPEEAFYFMEKNKAILLLEDISNYQAIKNAKLPLPLANKEFKLKNKINTVESQLQGITVVKENQKDSLQRQLYLSKRAYATFVDSLVIAYPEYGKYKKEIPIISFKKATEIRKKQNTLFLQYITTDEKAYGLLLGKENPLLFEIQGAKELPENIKQFQDLVTQKFVTVAQQKAYASVANTIFKKLVPEYVFQQIKDKQLIIIPDYRLQEVSFEALTTSEKVDSYLIKEVEISYAYSISYLENNNALTRKAISNFLGIAPVNFKALQLPTLQYTNTEANSLQNLLSGNVLLEQQATKTNFLQEGGNYKALHLATHAEVGTQSDPWLAFADAKLSLQELYGYKNQHDLVTLSACKTSLGKQQLGEGMMSLARGFFYGGAKSVVSSLWTANDKANAEIMVSFYEQLKEGMSKSKALRQAKLNYLKNHQGTEASPYYWGGNILIGDPATIALKDSYLNKKWKLIVFTLVLLISSLSFFFFKRKKKT